MVRVRGGVVKCDVNRQRGMEVTRVGLMVGMRRGGRGAPVWKMIHGQVTKDLGICSNQ